MAPAFAAARSRAWRRAAFVARVLVILGLGLGGSLGYNRLQASAPLRVGDLPTLDLAGVERLLVIAPHPDDETLGAGGLIQAALAEGAAVRVIVVTNGDGQWAGPIAVNGRVRPRPEDYVALGTLRQAETERALAHLGLAPEQVTFLGYPDGELDRLWRDDWTTACPLQARLTRATANPYAVPAADYCGRNLLNDLLAQIMDLAPQAIVVPHPADGHPDHRAVAAFARLAIAHAAQAEADYAPGVWGYLIHQGSFPQPRGWRLSRGLLPPAALLTPDAHWHRLDLTEAHLKAKGEAVRTYATQVRLLGSFLPSFVRRNELFVALPIVEVPRLAWQPTPDLAPFEWHTIAEPARESTRRLVLEGADLVSLQVARAGNQLWLTAFTRGRLLPGVQYQWLVKTPEGQTLTLRLAAGAVRTSLNSFTAQLDLAELNHPALLAVTAEVRQGATLDRTAWHLLLLDPAPDAQDLLEGL